MKLTLPFPISVNSYYRHTRKGVVLSGRGRTFKIDVMACVLEQIGLKKSLEGRIIMTTVLYPPTKIARDIDNYLKSLCDSLEKAGVFLNDSQIDVHHVYRGHVVPKGRTEVEIKEVDGYMFDEAYLTKLRSGD